MKKRLSLLFSATLCLGHAEYGYANESKDSNKPITCSYSHKELNTSGAAELHINDKKISRVYFKSYYPGGPGKLSFICDIDLKRNDAAYAWQDTESSILITTKETGDTIQLSHSKKKKGYYLNFANLNKLSKYCGAGADIPEDVFIPLSGKPCKVTMPH